MVAWWLIPVALITGTVFGIAIIAICTANGTDDGRKWWEDE